MNKRDLFEQNIKKAVEDYEAPMDTSAWDKIEKQLPVSSSKGLNNIKGWVAGVIIVAATATGYWYFSKPSINEDIDSRKHEKIEQIDLNKSEDAEIEEPSIEVEIQSSEPNVENSGQDVNFEKKEVIINSNDSEKMESTVSSPDEKFDEEKLIQVEPEQLNLETLESDESLMVNWIISKNVLCQGEEIMVAIKNVNEPVELVWDFGDGETSKDPMVYHKYKEPGTYIIKLKANSLISDKKVYREKKFIDVKANPQVSFSIVENEDMSAFPEVEFNNLTTYYSNIEWVFADKKIENKHSVNKFYRYKGRYEVGLIVTNHFGCKDSIFKDLIIENDYNLLALDSFTPDDDGSNDTFMPEALTFLNRNFSMQVINTKNGRLVFETKTTESPWNGKYNNSGELLENGLYAWTVKFEDGSIYSGTIKLISD